MVLTNVQGMGNAGYGLHVNDGNFVRITDNITMPVGNTGGVGAGQLVVGSLPNTLWSTFYAMVPPNQYDNTGPMATGSRTYVR